jgi:hypothetical protein
MRDALGRAKEKIKWTDTPSTDGKKYLTNGTRIALEALTDENVPGHFRFITANEEGDRNRTTSYAEFFFEHGEKGGPMATYLVDASQRAKFRLQMNTTVTRVLREGDTATGVEVESSGLGGLTGKIYVTPGTGRVILSAGVFNTFKVLVRSGIGPGEDVQRVANQSTEGAKLPPRKDWLDLPVGQNLGDGSNFNIGVHVPWIEIYPWVQLWNSTIENPDIRRYLENRTGPLAQLQPSLGPVSWDTVTGQDGKKRVIQWDCSSGRDPRLPGDGKYTAPLKGCWANSRYRRLYSLHIEPQSRAHVARSPLSRPIYSSHQHINIAVLQRQRGPRLCCRAHVIYLTLFRAQRYNLAIFTWRIHIFPTTGSKHRAVFEDTAESE